jgi:hypothetical protein
MSSTTHVSTKQVIDPGISEKDIRIFSAILFVVDIVLPPALIIFGLIGNFLANLVLRQPHNAKLTTCFYMRVLSFFDSLILLYKVTIRTAVNYNPDFMLSLQNGPFVCPTMAFSDCTFGLSNWTVAAMTLDRFLAVRFPLKAAGWCTKRRCKITLLTIVTFCICLTIPYSIRGLNTSANVNKEICRFDPAVFPHWYPKTIYLLQTSCLFTAPFFTVLLFNVSIIWTLISQKIHKPDYLPSNETQTRRPHNSSSFYRDLHFLHNQHSMDAGPMDLGCAPKESKCASEIGQKGRL